MGYAVAGYNVEKYGERRELFRSPRAALGPAEAWVRANRWRRGVSVATVHEAGGGVAGIFTLRVEQDGEPCLIHELVGPDLETETVTCERCGYTEDADPDDVAEQYRLLAEIDAGGE